MKLPPPLFNKSSKDAATPSGTRSAPLANTRPAPLAQRPSVRPTRLLPLQDQEPPARSPSPASSLPPGVSSFELVSRAMAARAEISEHERAKVKTFWSDQIDILFAEIKAEKDQKDEKDDNASQGSTDMDESE